VKLDNDWPNARETEVTCIYMFSMSRVHNENAQETEVTCIYVLRVSRVRDENAQETDLVKCTCCEARQ
jgi:hypothetical protein